MYLECGWVGLAFYWGFFVLVFFRLRKMKRTVGKEGIPYCQMAEIMAVLCLAISVYNSSLRTEAGYMAFFVLAIPFAIHKRQRRGHCEKVQSGF